jgi:hypothetical protein
MAEVFCNVFLDIRASESAERELTHRDIGSAELCQMTCAVVVDHT